MIPRLGLNLWVSILMLFLTVLLFISEVLFHWYASPDTESDRETDLERKVGGNTLGPSTTPKGNEFTLEVVEGSFEVYESESLVYRLFLKPLPFGWGGFRGETQVEIAISGDVRVEEAVLIKQIASNEKYRQLIGDLQLQNDRLCCVINDAEVSKVREALTGVEELVAVKDESVAEDVIRVSDHVVLGELVAGGVARSVVLDVAFPNAHIWQYISRPTKNFLQGTIGRMNRTFIWVRQRPRKQRSTVKIRFRDPSHPPEEYTLGPLEALSFWVPMVETTSGSQRLHTLLYMGYGVTREFLEVENPDDAIVEHHGVEYLSVSLARSKEKLENASSKVDWEDIGTGFLGVQKGREEELPTVLKVACRMVDQKDLPEREEVLIPVSPITVEEFETSDVTAIDWDGLTEIDSAFEESIATVITAGGSGTIRAYYRAKDAPLYFALEWRADGSVKLFDSGRPPVGEPLDTDGFVLWHRLHQGRARAYQPTEIEGTDLFFVPEV